MKKILRKIVIILSMVFAMGILIDQNQSGSINIQEFLTNDEKQLIIVGKKVAHLKFHSMETLARELNRYNMLHMHGESGALDLSSISSLFGGKSKNQNQPQAMPGYSSTMKDTLGDTGYATNANLISNINLSTIGKTVRIFEFTVPPRYQYVWGSGILGLPANQGYMAFWAAILTTAFALGKLTLAVESYDRHNFVPVFEATDNILHLSDYTSAITATPTNQQTMVALPETRVVAQPYSRLVINYMSIIAAQTNTSAYMSFPVTVASS